MIEPIVTTGQLDAYLTGDPQSALDAATAAVRAYCGWHVAPSQVETVTVDADGHTVLLPSLHVTAVSSVTVDDVLLEAEAFDWSAAGILRLTASACGFRKVTVVMTHGYEDAPEVSEVILRAAARGTATSPGGGVSPFPLNRAQVGQIGEDYAIPSSSSWAGGSSLTDADRQILDRYKLPPRP